MPFCSHASVLLWNKGGNFKKSMLHDLVAWFYSWHLISTEQVCLSLSRKQLTDSHLSNKDVVIKL